MKAEMIEKGLLEIPVRMHELEKSLMTKNQEKRELEAEIAKKEAWMRYEISNETIVENEKEKKKYSNAEQREYAFMERTKENTSYLNTKMILIDKEREIESLKIDYNYEKAMHRSMLAIAQLVGSID
jgi:hypothetical protein